MITLKGFLHLSIDSVQDWLGMFRVTHAVRMPCQGILLIIIISSSITIIILIILQFLYDCYSYYYDNIKCFMYMYVIEINENTISFLL